LGKKTSRFRAAALLLATACGSTGSNPEAARDAGGTGADGGSDSGPVADATADSPPVDGTSPGDALEGPDGPVPPASDAAPDVDNGMPSTMYPAPHPPLPQLTNAQGGPVLATPRVHLVLYPNNADQTTLQTFAQRVATSTYWTATTSEYGIGALSYAGTTVLSGQTAPAMITSGQIQTWMAQQIGSGAFGPPDPQAIYTVVYPAGTLIQQPNPVSPVFGPVGSCTNFGGYHDNVAVTPADGGTAINFAYAVLATCSASVDDLTATMSHEWVEASTDPQDTATGVFTLTPAPNSAYFSVDSDHVVWDVLGIGGEAGDLCKPEGPSAYYTPPDVGNAVQRTWSNQLAAASHDPCAPDLAGQPFFDSAPVLDETVTFTSTLTGKITTKGVTIPMGQSRTIEVDLFSDAATSGPWTVTAEDLLAKLYGSYGILKSLTFAWDRAQGTNGEKLHLTITVTGGSILGGAHAFVISSTLGNRTYAWPGLVVE
jgi:hypothetical protein